MKITRTPNLADGKTYGLSEGEFTNLPSPRDRPRPGPTTHNPLVVPILKAAENTSLKAAENTSLAWPLRNAISLATRTSPTFSLSYEKF